MQHKGIKAPVIAAGIFNSKSGYNWSKIDSARRLDDILEYDSVQSGRSKNIRKGELSHLYRLELLQVVAYWIRYRTGKY